MTKGKAMALAALGGAVGLVTGGSLAAAPDGTSLSEAEKMAVFKTAKAVQRKGKWVVCADDPNGTGATIETVRDLNGDGLPEVVVTEGGSFCYGAAEMGYQLLSKQANGSWRVMSRNSGIPQFLSSRGANGWPDISVGGPGFCFPVERWNGKVYTLHRFEYEGKRCNPPR